MGMKPETQVSHFGLYFMAENIVAGWRGSNSVHTYLKLHLAQGLFLSYQPQLH